MTNTAPKVSLKRIVRRINTALTKTNGLGEAPDLRDVMEQIAPEYGLTYEALYQRIRRVGGRLGKQIILPGD